VGLDATVEFRQIGQGIMGCRDGGIPQQPQKGRFFGVLGDN